MQINVLARKKGVSLVETLIYVAILAALFIVLVNLTLGYAQSYRQLTALKLADQTAVDALERMTREIRASGAIDSATVFGGTQGMLSLSKTTGGTTAVTQFYLDSGVLKMRVNGMYFGNLSPAGATVTGLTFTQLSNSVSKAVKIDMTVVGASGQHSVTKSYHSTIVLKGS